jgi:hypothetical protein
MVLNKVLLLSLLSIFVGYHGIAQENMPLPFKTWKEQQITEARNVVIRITNRRTLAKASLKSADTESPKTRTVATEEIGVQQHVQRPANLETELQQANENLASAKELSFEDYVTVYLAAFRDRPDVLAVISQKLTKEEVAILLNLVVNRASSQDARTSAKPLVDGLLAGDHSR